MFWPCRCREGRAFYVACGVMELAFGRATFGAPSEFGVAAPFFRPLRDSERPPRKRGRHLLHRVPIAFFVKSCALKKNVRTYVRVCTYTRACARWGVGRWRCVRYHANMCADVRASPIIVRAFFLVCCRFRSAAPWRKAGASCPRLRSTIALRSAVQDARAMRRPWSSGPRLSSLATRDSS